MSIVEVKVPPAGESVTEASISQIIAKSGTYVKEDDFVVELETDKASMELPAPASGILTLNVKEEDVCQVGQVIGTIDTSAAPPAESAPPKEEAKPKEEAPPPPPPPPPHAAPTPTGSGARESADAYLNNVGKDKPAPSAPAPSKPVEGGSSRKKMSKLRQTIAKRLVDVKQETAMLTTFNEVDMSAIMKLRSREKDNFLKKHNAKLTFLPFFIQASIAALKAFPEVNAFIEGTDIVYNDHTHIGLAVSTDKGLVVPVMKNADTLSFLEITHAITELATKARDRKLTIDDMSGGTFTITNGGVFGSMLSTPILNAPQSAILGMHNIVERPIAVDGKVEIRPIMYLALSYDHRIIDGKDSVQFLVQIKKLLEDPGLFLLEG